jgi:hypothetical protein
VKRSVRQGDPLASILFIILMDSLHDGLEVNPFTGERHGCTLAMGSHPVYLSSLGFADDTTVICNSLRDLRVQNEWVAYFMQFNIMQLNPLKCELVGRGSDGEPVSEAATLEITINGHGQVREESGWPGATAQRPEGDGVGQRRGGKGRLETGESGRRG